VVEREGERPRRFSLRRAPELRGLLGGFAALLGGDRAALERAFEAQLEGSGTDWRLTLVPRDAALRRQLASLVVDGRDAAPRCFLSTESDGDRSLMRVGAAAAWVDPPDADLAALHARCTAAD
jgi:Outer membrane lipoprotein carrier protein LolA-like